VSFFDRGSEGGDVAEMFAVVRREKIEVDGGVIVGEKALEWEGLPAREYEVVTRHGGRFWFRVILSGDRVFVLAAGVPKTAWRKNVDRSFFASFRVDEGFRQRARPE
jgi:hypothetical protein